MKTILFPHFNNTTNRLDVLKINIVSHYKDCVDSVELMPVKVNNINTLPKMFIQHCDEYFRQILSIKNDGRYTFENIELKFNLATTIQSIENRQYIDYPLKYYNILNIDNDMVLETFVLCQSLVVIGRNDDLFQTFEYDDYICVIPKLNFISMITTDKYYKNFDSTMLHVYFHVSVDKAAWALNKLYTYTDRIFEYHKKLCHIKNLYHLYETDLENLRLNTLGEDRTIDIDLSDYNAYPRMKIPYIDQSILKKLSYYYYNNNYIIPFAGNYSKLEKILKLYNTALPLTTRLIV